MKKIIVFLAIALPLMLVAQDLSNYYEMVKKGELVAVREALPRLRQQYPDNADVLYLSGLVETDGEKALLIFKDVFSRYTDSDKGDDAFMRIIEYLYTKGLYYKTVKYAKRMIGQYPNSDLLSNCTQLLLASYNVMGEKDSVNYYYNYYSARIPNLQPNFDNYQFTPGFSVGAAPIGNPEKVTARTVSEKPVVPEPQPVKTPVTAESGSYTLQLGAFSQTANATRLKEQLRAFGFEPVLEEGVGSSGNLVVVKLGQYATREEAQQAGERLKSQYGYDYFVMIQK